MSLTLRPYQRAAKEKLRRLVASGIKRPLVVAPTGAGKTVLFTSIVESAIERGSRVLICAHRRELVRQPWTKALRAGIDPAKVGVILAGVPAGPAKAILGQLSDASDDMLWECLARRRPDAPVQVASIDSIRNRAKPQADLLIIDEAHRVLSASYIKLAEEYPNAVICGFTATPLRADNKPLGSFFQDMIIVATYRELIASGHLVEPRVFTVPDACLPDLSRVRIKGGDFDTSDLQNVCDTPGLIGDAVEHWKRHGNNAPTIAFCVSVEHSRHVVERFNAAGIPALHVDANTPTAERDAALHALRIGEVKLIGNVDVCTEGLDITAIKTVMLLRPSRSTRIFMQQVGRGSRPDQSGLPFVVLDHCGMCLEMGLPHMIEWDPAILHNTKDRSGVRSAPARTCPSCWACLPASTKECPCGHVFQTEPKSMVEEHDGELVEVVAPSLDDLKASWDGLVSDCLSNGYAPAWCFARWGELYPGIRPPDGCVPPSAEECAKVKNERAEILDGYLATAMERGYKVMGWSKGSFKSRCGVYPSFDLFQKTKTAGMVAEMCEAMVGWSKRCSARAVSEPLVVPVSVVQSTPAPLTVPVANDLVEYDIAG